MSCWSCGRPEYEHGREMEYTLADGSKRYEVAFSRSEAIKFYGLHNAVSMKPRNYDER